MANGNGNSTFSSVRRMVSAATNALHQDDPDDFEDVIRSTRRSFRRNDSYNSDVIRGRRSVNFYKRRTILLRRAKADFFPIKSECEMLSSHGLGK